MTKYHTDYFESVLAYHIECVNLKSFRVMIILEMCDVKNSTPRMLIFKFYTFPVLKSQSQWEQINYQWRSLGVSAVIFYVMLDTYANGNNNVAFQINPSTAKGGG